jgi:hypothetical protein
MHIDSSNVGDGKDCIYRHKADFPNVSYQPLLIMPVMSNRTKEVWMCCWDGLLSDQGLVDDRFSVLEKGKCFGVVVNILTLLDTVVGLVEAIKSVGAEYVQ